MFKPKYQVTNKLLATIKRIAEICTQLNARRFPRVIMLELEREAREISSFSSTSIEGNPLPLTDVKRILKHAPAHIRDTEREVLNYNSALKELKNQVDEERIKFDLKLILGTQERVIKGLLPKSATGKMRKEPVFVNDPRSGKTVFWPPDHADVPSLIKELVEFVEQNRGSIDPLIMAGIFHKQFVLIHPFVDGNGRTVRLLTKVLLAGMGLDTFHLFSFERYYNANVSKYFTSVGERGNYYDLRIDYTAWLEYFTDGVLDELLRVQKELERSSSPAATSMREHHKLILKYIDQHGTITHAEYAKLVPRAKATRALDFEYLLHEGLIMRHARGRATYYTRKK